MNIVKLICDIHGAFMASAVVQIVRALVLVCPIKTEKYLLYKVLLSSLVQCPNNAD